MSPTLESGGLMKKRCCSALQCNVSYSPQPDTSEVSARRVAGTGLLWMTAFAFSPVLSSGSLCL